MGTDVQLAEVRRTGRATARGTCGELVQGVLASGEHFHVTCPIERGATVALQARGARRNLVTGLADDQAKLGQALLHTARVLGTGPLAITVATRSELHVGKGMGSSTADIVAGARALAAAHGASLSPAQLARIATAIEPSDGTMYPGVVAFCRQTGDVVRAFSWHPRFAAVMVLPPRTVATDSVDLGGKARLATAFEELLACLDDAVERRDPLPFAQVATRSAALNQRVLPNRLFGALAALRARLGAAGVVVGHTGTLGGLLYPFLHDEPESAADALERARRAAALLRSLPLAGAAVEVAVTAAPPPAASPPRTITPSPGSAERTG